MSHYLKKQQRLVDQALSGTAGMPGLSRGGLSEASAMQFKVSGAQRKSKNLAAKGKKK